MDAARRDDRSSQTQQLETRLDLFHLVDVDSDEPRSQEPAADEQRARLVDRRLIDDVLNDADASVRPLDPEPLTAPEPVVDGYG
jgi:hypothetical protein